MSLQKSQQSYVSNESLSYFTGYFAQSLIYVALK